MWVGVGDNVADMRRSIRHLLCVTLLALCFVTARGASAQERNSTWGGVSTATAITAVSASVLMPRIFYSSPEATIGWRARWHVSVLAPMMTQMSLAYLNDAVLKDAFKEPRPGCTGLEGANGACDSYALFATRSYLSGASLGQGLAVFLFDTFQYSGGKVHFGGLAGNVMLPLILAGATVGAETAGDYSTFGQSIASAGVGLGTGIIMGAIYGGMQKPECGYSGSLICW